KCADGRWVHQWTPMPGILAAAQGDSLTVTPEVKAKMGASLIGVVAGRMPALQDAMPEFDRTFARFPASEWERAAIEAGISCQTVRSPEEALTDPLLVADGAVTEIDDPEVGRIRQLGRLWRFQKCDWNVRGPAPAPGQHTDEVKAEAAATTAIPKRAAK